MLIITCHGWIVSDKKMREIFNIDETYDLDCWPVYDSFKYKHGNETFDLVPLSIEDVETAEFHLEPDEFDTIVTKAMKENMNDYPDNNERKYSVYHIGRELCVSENEPGTYNILEDAKKIVESCNVPPKCDAISTEPPLLFRLFH